MTHHPDRQLLDDLQSRLDRELTVALQGARRVALLNFPNHNNPGDSAIWLGARASLKRLGVTVAYQCAWSTFNLGALNRNARGAPVLLNGGGNFGDLYGGQQGLRELVFKKLRDRRIIQLPQSIHFRSDKNLSRVKKLIEAHGNVTLMLREQKSLELAREHFAAETMLAPDCAFGLGSLPRLPDPRAAVVWLHRRGKDPEFVDRGEIFTADWLARHAPGQRALDIEWLQRQPEEPAWSLPHRLARTANKYLLAKAAAQPRWAHRAWRPLGWTFTPLGRGYTRRGLHIMDRGQLLVTDKLHGHIMALLAGIEHVVLDNSYGKVSGTFNTWTSGSQLAHWADTGPEAEQIAARLLARRETS